MTEKKIDDEAYGMDCQPGPSTYPKKNLEEIMPDYVREAIAAAQARRKKQQEG